MLGRQEVQDLINHFSKYVPKLIEDLVPKLVPLSLLQKVLHNLLVEGVHIRDLRSILEALAARSATKNPSKLTVHVRAALSHAIVQQVTIGPITELNVIVLDTESEKILQQVIGVNAVDTLGIEPGLAETLLRDTAAAVQRQDALGQPPVMLVADRLRLPLAKMLRRIAPQLSVLGHSEVPDSRNIKVSSIVGGRT